LIHKVCPVTDSAVKLAVVQHLTGATKSIRLRLSPKALKMSHKHSHSLDSSTGEVAGKPIVEFDKEPTPSEVNKVSPLYNLRCVGVYRRCELPRQLCVQYVYG